MLEQELQLVNPLGLHARAAAKLVRCAGRFASRVTLHCGEKTADAKSILSVLTLAAACGAELKIRADGADEAAAIEEIRGLVDAGFGEI